MRKTAFLALILPFSALGGLALLAPIAPILAREQLSSAEAVKDTFELPTSPLDELINKWLGGGLKEAAQESMTKAQSGIQEATGQAIGSAQEAVKDEISKQANQAVQGLKKKAEAYVGGVVATIKTAINNLIAKIKLFFTDLFKKPAPKY